MAESILDELVEHLALGLCHQTHRAAKLGYLELEEVAAEEESKYLIVNEPGVDVFGESSTLQVKKQYECTCPHCDRTLAASRFAPHLEKCMGMGRNSSRIASKRIANSGRSNGNNNSSVNNNGGGTATSSVSSIINNNNSNSSNNGISSSLGLDSDLEDNDKSSDNDWSEKPVVKKSRKKRKTDHVTSNGIVKRNVRKVVSNQHNSSSLDGFARNPQGQFINSSGISSPSNRLLSNSPSSTSSSHLIHLDSNQIQSNSSSVGIGFTPESSLTQFESQQHNHLRTTRLTSSAASSLLDSHPIASSSASCTSTTSNMSSINTTIVQIESQREFQF